MITDYEFFLPLITHLKYFLNSTAKNQARKNFYVYEFAHSSAINYLLEFMKNMNIDYSSHMRAYNNNVIPHFSELDYMFGLPLLSRAELIKTKNATAGYAYNYTNEEYELSERMIKYWSNFVKYG